MIILNLFSFLLAFAYGAALGSFANVLVGRLPKDQSLLTPPSHCEFCNAPLKPVDLVPVISFVFLNGHCRYCGGELPKTEPIIELICGALGVAAWLRWGSSVYTLFATPFFVGLLALAIIDFREKVIFDVMLWGGAGLLLLWPRFWQDPVSAIAGAVICALVFWLIRTLGTAIWKREAMGEGDVKLALVVGLWLGLANIPAFVAVAFVLGMVASLTLIFSGRAHLADEIPFAPYMCAAAFILLMIY